MNSQTNEQGKLLSQTAITEIMAKLDLPNGFSKLDINQRKFLVAAVLGSIVAADGKIRAVEMQNLKEHLQTKYNLKDEALKLALSNAYTGLSAEHLKKAVGQLSELLSIEDRTALIRMLWDLAICDNELHSKEEILIYNIADNAGVPRKRVTEQQARAQSHHSG
jgi:uncharacterized tellurite resistance protein B-like protein